MTVPRGDGRAGLLLHGDVELERVGLQQRPGVGLVCPATLGTVTWFGPADTTTLTVVPGLACCPAAGSVRITVALGRCRLVSAVLVTTKPGHAAWRWRRQATAR